MAKIKIHSIIKDILTFNTNDLSKIQDVDQMSDLEKEGLIKDRKKRKRSATISLTASLIAVIFGLIILIFIIYFDQNGILPDTKTGLLTMAYAALPLFAFTFDLTRDDSIVDDSDNAGGIPLEKWITFGVSVLILITLLIYYLASSGNWENETFNLMFELFVSLLTGLGFQAIK